MTTSKQKRKLSPKRKPEAEADLPVLLTAQSTSLGTLADIFPPELVALAQTGKQIVSDIKEMSTQERDAIIQVGKQKGQVTSGTQQILLKVLEKLPEPVSETDRANMLEVLKEVTKAADNADHRDHQFRTQHAQLLRQQQGNARLEVLNALVYAGLGFLFGYWWANRE